MSQNPTQTRPRPQEEEINLREELSKYLRHWPWFVAGVIICLFGAFMYLRYTTPIYNTKATVIIKDEKNGNMPSEMSAFADLGMLGSMGTNSIENEIGILRSERLMTNVARELNLHIRYFKKGEVRTTELFANKPFKVQILAFDAKRFAEIEEKEPLIFTITSDSTYTVEMEASGFSKKMNFGEALNIPYAQLSVTPVFENTSAITVGEPVEVSITTLDKAAIAYQQKIQVNLTDKNSSLIEISLQDPVKEKARQIVDQLIFEYNQQAIADKNLVSLNTANFIEDRLEIITRELDSVETGKEEFKKENQLTDIEEESKVFIENANDFRNRQLEVETQLELANTMIDYLKSDNEGLLPANLGFREEGVTNVIQSYNQLVLERDRILAGSTQDNPIIVNLNNQIQQIKANVLQSLNNMRTSLRIARNDLNAQEAKIDAQIAGVPSKEKQFRNIERQQNIKEALYLYLLQKREETSLSLAVTAPKAKIVDVARSSEEPVSPKTKIIYLAALILGLIIPFLIIYLKNLLNNKVHSRNDIENIHAGIPILGEIPRLGKNTTELIQENDRSILAESFRVLHNNLRYLLLNTQAKTGGNTILVTSSIKGEGKTFTAFNLAVTLANNNNKVLIVGGDLRNPQLQRFEQESKRYQGVSDYLISDEVKLTALIKKSTLHKNLDLLASGSIPPNPSELLGREKTRKMFEELETMYDYVVIDTAPSMLIVDTFLINQYADLTLYVVRAGLTEKDLLHFPVDAINEGKLKNLGFVINDVDSANYGYGNKYGYAYGQEQAGFWKRLKNRAAIW
ncbi:tyrosine protein kinase [Salinimicrobium marinum]|uniref:non-specific protein-tyrosine kinase n=1 Tax=Salinimicrobium marinum TaxID=680283 RepID=A0A918SIE6_9FLAO|nr:tyrosine-protein kinase family protein [Salinimicrobium marinum]GHA46149.1 tyrosine protein kinase [Salinimicrobium marinum]